MARETQRQRAERLSAQSYFTYARRTDRGGYYGWVPVYMRTMDISEVLCTECDYVPRANSTQPRRAFKAHVKKHHARLYSEKFMKPFIIHEEPDFVFGRELANV